MEDLGFPPEPKPPAGIHGPNVEGAGNLLDASLRAELRKLIRDTVEDTLRKVASDLLDRLHHQQMPNPAPPGLPAESPAAPRGTQAGPAPPAPASAAPAAAPAAEDRGDPPFPHGDVDLRAIPANVPTAQERRPRRGGSRRFYFLED